MHTGTRIAMIAAGAFLSGPAVVAAGERFDSASYDALVEKLDEAFRATGANSSTFTSAPSGVFQSLEVCRLFFSREDGTHTEVVFNPGYDFDQSPSFLGNTDAHYVCNFWCGPEPAGEGPEDSVCAFSANRSTVLAFSAAWTAVENFCLSRDPASDPESAG